MTANVLTCHHASQFTTLGDLSFHMAAQKLWSDLPLSIRIVPSVNGFKKALKTHLFQKAFPS